MHANRNTTADRSNVFSISFYSRLDLYSWLLKTNFICIEYALCLLYCLSNWNNGMITQTQVWLMHFNSANSQLITFNWNLLFKLTLEIGSYMKFIKYSFKKNILILEKAMCIVTKSKAFMLPLQPTVVTEHQCFCRYHEFI